MESTIIDLLRQQQDDDSNYSNSVHFLLNLLPKDISTISTIANADSTPTVTTYDDSYSTTPHSVHTTISAVDSIPPTTVCTVYSDTSLSSLEAYILLSFELCIIDEMLNEKQ